MTTFCLEEVNKMIESEFPNHKFSDRFKFKASEVNTEKDMLSSRHFFNKRMYWPLFDDRAKEVVMQHINEKGVKGDIIELGCGKGRNLMLFAARSEDRKVYGFDTFSGYTEQDMQELFLNSKDEKIISDIKENMETGRWDDNSEQVIKDKITSNSYEQRVEIIKGDIYQTTKNFVPESGKISILYIDCNLHRPSKAGIENLQQYFSDGCLVISDSGFYPPPEELVGEHKALIDYKNLSGNKLYRTYFGDYMAFFVEVVR